MSAEREIKIKNLDVIIPCRKDTRLRWKEFQILSLLVNRSPELVSRAEIIKNIWQGTYCSDSTINQTIKSIRQKIGDAEHTLIRTIPRLGYKVDNKAVFHFISAAEPILPTEPILSGDSCKDIDEEWPEEENKGHVEPDEINLMEHEVVDSVTVAEKNWPSIKATQRACCKQTQACRAVKYLAVFISLLVVSLLSYALGHRSKPAMQHELPNNPRLVLSLDLPAGGQLQTLHCAYQEGAEKEMRVSCRVP